MEMILMIMMLAATTCCSTETDDGWGAEWRQSVVTRMEIPHDEHLHLAAAARDLDELRAVLESERFDIDRTIDVGRAPDHRGITALMIATWDGWVEGVSTLIAHGADVSVPSAREYRALHFAARTAGPSAVECISLLIEAGADVNRDMGVGGTPLSLAAQLSDPSVVEALLDHSAEPDIFALCGATLNLDFADRIAALLIDRGAPLVGECWEEMYPLEFAIRESGNVAAALVIVEHLDAEHLDDRADDDGNTPFLHAARIPNCELLQAMIAKGVNTRRVNHRGENALHLVAARWWHEALFSLECFETLIEHVHDVHQRDIDGRTPLMRLPFSRPSRAASALIARGADITARDNRGDTALHIMLREGYVGVAEELISLGADLNLPDSEGLLPIERVESWIRRKGDKDRRRFVSGGDSVSLEVWQQVHESTRSRQQM